MIAVVLILIGTASAALVPMHPGIDAMSKPCLTVNCFLNPCMMARCNKHHQATCRADYCGGCHARFYEGDNEVTSQC
ncbi:hypothetical protein ScPMuIL_003363 [Solemya velum]